MPTIVKKLKRRRKKDVRFPMVTVFPSKRETGRIGRATPQSIKGANREWLKKT